MVIFFDGIIFKLQQTGGISVLFNELITRLPPDSYKLLTYIKNTSNLSNINSSYQSPRLLERYRNVDVASDFDIFHSTYYRTPKVKKCKVVTTVYDYTYEKYVSGFRSTIHSWQKNKAISESDKIICGSESTRNDLIEYSGSAFSERTVVIYNGVSNNYHSLSNVNTKQQVLFVGARSGYKNFKSVVCALENIKDLTLVCVGGGGFTAKERRLLEKHLYCRYSHLGYLTNSALNQVYNESFCLVYPSLYEGFGIPVLEAMQAGCPVIAVNSSSIPEVAGDAAFLIEKGTHEEIRDAILTLFDSSKRKTMVLKGLIQSKKFSWDITFNKTLQLYKELM